MERSDKLDHLVSQIDTIPIRDGQFADPFPPECASRDQVEALRVEVGNMRQALVAVLSDQFAELFARLDRLEGNKP